MLRVNQNNTVANTCEVKTFCVRDASFSNLKKSVMKHPELISTLYSFCLSFHIKLLVLKKHLSTNLRRIDAEILKWIESDEDVTNVSVHLKLIVPLLEMTDYYLLLKMFSKTYTKLFSIKVIMFINATLLQLYLIQKFQVYQIVIRAAFYYQGFTSIYPLVPVWRERHDHIFLQS